MKQKLKLALVGAGERGQYCYAPYAKMHGYEIEFVAVADPHKGRREKFVQDYHVPAEGVFETAEQFFARPRMADAVLICTQDSQHYAYACQAIDLGYSILLEKPISPSVRECLDLQRRAEEKGTQIMVCHVMRYTKFYRKLKELIDSGKFGAPMVIKCTHRADGVADDYTTAMAVTDTAIHEIDVLPWLVNDEWDEVQCIMPKTNSKVKNALKDPQIMIMKTKGGIINMLEVNVNCGFGYDINCEVVCENGVVNLPCPSFPTVRYANEVSTKIEDNWILRFIDSYDVEIQDWVDHALKGETGGSSAWDGYVASITADALVKSQTSGVPEKVVTGGTPDFYKK